MNNYIAHIEVPKGRLKEILDELTKAQNTARKCWDELDRLGVLVITKAPSEKDDAK